MFVMKYLVFVKGWSRIDRQANGKIFRFSGITEQNENKWKEHIE